MLEGRAPVRGRPPLSRATRPSDSSLTLLPLVRLHLAGRQSTCAPAVLSSCRAAQWKKTKVITT
jgi:hypothetical protein